MSLSTIKLLASSLLFVAFASGCAGAAETAGGRFGIPVGSDPHIGFRDDSRRESGGFKVKPLEPTSRRTSSFANSSTRSVSGFGSSSRGQY